MPCKQGQGSSMQDMGVAMNLPALPAQNTKMKVLRFSSTEHQFDVQALHCSMYAWFQ